MTLSEVITAAKKLSPKEQQLLVAELKGEWVPTDEQRADIDRAIAAAEAGDIVPGSEILAMLRRG